LAAFFASHLARVPAQRQRRHWSAPG
jgi:hypothetical protein